MLVTQSGPTLLDPTDWNPPGSSVHGISQARILEWVTVSFSRGSSWPRDQTQVSCISGRFFIFWATREAQVEKKGKSIKKVLPNESSPKLQCEKKSWFIKRARCQTCLQKAEGRIIPPPGESSYQNPWGATEKHTHFIFTPIHINLRPQMSPLSPSAFETHVYTLIFITFFFLKNMYLFGCTGS